MSDISPKLLQVFFDVQRGLPRQGPGSSSSTIRALELCSNLPDNPTVLDIGCGPGMQTMTLAGACSGNFIAVDTCDEYLDELRRRVQHAHLEDRVETKNADMKKLDFPAESFDLLWCEGAAYNMGIAAALQAWRSLLRNQGYLAFTELVWLEEEPAAEVAEFFRDEYPAMTSVEAIKKVVDEADYELIGDFALPDSAWWEDYYTPLEAKLPALSEKYADDEEALGVIATTETEIDMRRRFGQSYGYQFFVVRKVG